MRENWETHSDILSEMHFDMTGEFLFDPASELLSNQYLKKGTGKPFQPYNPDSWDYSPGSPFHGFYEYLIEYLGGEFQFEEWKDFVQGKAAETLRPFRFSRFSQSRFAKYRLQCTLQLINMARIVSKARLIGISTHYQQKEVADLISKYTKDPSESVQMKIICANFDGFNERSLKIIYLAFSQSEFQAVRQIAWRKNESSNNPNETAA